MATEVWKDIKEYEGLYQVSNFGRLKSLTKRGGKTPRILKQQDRNGYKRVPLTDNSGVRKYKSVHLLVLTTFKGKKIDCECNHKDGDKSNNNIENLEWLTRSQNQKHAFDNGLQIPLLGEQVNNSKLLCNDVLQIRSIYEQGWATLKELGDAWGVSKANVHSIVKNKTWRHI